jgi:hypothetical protein
MCFFWAKGQVGEKLAQVSAPAAMLNLAPKTTQYTMKLEQTPDSFKGKAFEPQSLRLFLERGQHA